MTTTDQWWGEMRCIGSMEKDDNFTIWEKFHKMREEDMLVEVENVKAHLSSS